MYDIHKCRDPSAISELHVWTCVLNIWSLFLLIETTKNVVLDNVASAFMLLDFALLGSCRIWDV